MKYLQQKLKVSRLPITALFGCLAFFGFSTCSAKINSTASTAANQDTSKNVAQHKTTNTMNELQAKAIAAITLPEDQYFQLNNATVLPVQQAFSKALNNDDPFSNSPQKAAASEQVFVIKTPALIEENLHQTIPLLIGSAQTGQHHWEVRYETNTASILTNLDNGEVYIQWPFIVDKRALTRDPSMHGPKPDDVNATAMLRGVRYRDLRVVYMDYKWIPARYALTLIDYDWVSNTETFELRSLGTKTKAPVPEHRYSALYGNIKSESSGQRTTLEGFSFDIADKLPINSPIPLSFSIEMPFSETGLSRLVPVNGKEELPVAIMLFQKDNDYPVLMNFSVPVTTELHNGLEVIKAAETLDLSKGLDGRELAGDFLVFFNVGKNLYGPKRLTIGE
ncbi:MAG: hypothetical protein JST36_02025 [Bacteroidetes bacterium]|nr:hypothetical protein [Bacteroidota bacterium]